MKAVIFDFDGVIAGSMDKHIDAFRHALKGKAEVKESDIYSLEGDSSQRIIQKLLGKESVDKEVLELTEKKRDYYHKQIPNVKVEEEALKLAKDLKEDGIQVAIATGTIRDNVKKILGEKLGIFDLLVTAEEVEKGKPDPEVYLKTAEKLGIKPEECVVIENAPSGIQAAKKAGMTCIAITTTLQAKQLKEADETTENFDEIRSSIKKIRESTN